MIAACLKTLLGNLRPTQPQRVQQLRRIRLLHKFLDPPVLVVMHNAEPGRQLAIHRDRRNRQLSLLLNVRRDDLAKIHPVKLIPAQDQKILKIIRQQMVQIFANRICGALIPRVARRCLLSRQNLHEPT